MRRLVAPGFVYFRDGKSGLLPKVTQSMKISIPSTLSPSNSFFQISSSSSTSSLYFDFTAIITRQIDYDAAAPGVDEITDINVTSINIYLEVPERLEVNHIFVSTEILMTSSPFPSAGLNTKVSCHHATGQYVITSTAVQRIVTSTAVQRIVTITTFQHIHAFIAVNYVSTCEAFQRIVIGSTIYHIVAGIAVNGIFAATTHEDVVTATALQDVRIFIAGKSVVLAGTGEILNTAEYVAHCVALTTCIIAIACIRQRSLVHVPSVGSNISS